jgi:hypothetical protein
LLPAAALIVGLSLTTPELMASTTSIASTTTPESMTPRLSADLDGDGKAEAVTASASRGAVSLTVEGGSAKRPITAKAPAPAQDVVRVSLTAAALGTPGSLLEVSATTDASECLSVWRYHDGALTRLPIRGVGGRALPDCAPRSGGSGSGDGGAAWTHRWERPAADAPSVLVRERTTEVARGTLRNRETYSFAGFSLDLDPERSGADVNGVPIPAWYDARYYTHSGLQQLYARFDVPALRAMPSLAIESDRDRGIFNLRFRRGSEEIVAPVESFSSVRSTGTASIVARAGEKAVHADVRLGGDGNVPYQLRVDGLEPELDQLYGPAGAWEGSARHVFPSAADETVAEYLDGDWRTPQGGKVTMGPDGPPPYRVRIEERVFTLDFDHAPKGADIALLPTDGSRRGWAIVLAGPNGLDRLPVDCESGGDGSACRPDGSPERLRRMGARINVN